MAVPLAAVLPIRNLFFQGRTLLLCWLSWLEARKIVSDLVDISFWIHHCHTVHWRHVVIVESNRRILVVPRIRINPNMCVFCCLSFSGHPRYRALCAADRYRRNRSSCAKCLPVFFAAAAFP